MTTTADPAYSAPELRAAAQALAAGHFAHARRQEPGLPVGGGSRWAPGGRLIRLTAGHAGAGATTMALALADAAATEAPVRLLDAAAPAWSGLCGATEVELGAEAGWRRGRRGTHLVIDRVADASVVPAQVPLPRACPGTEWTVLDTGWLPRELAAHPESWLATVEPTVDVVVTRASETGFSQADLVASTLDPARTVLVVLGATRRSHTLLAGAGPRIRQLWESDAIGFVPLLPARLLRGLGPDPLPRPLQAAAQRLLDRLTPISGPTRSGRP